jgi:hypothetical protein
MLELKARAELHTKAATEVERRCGRCRERGEGEAAEEEEEGERKRREREREIGRERERERRNEFSQAERKVHSCI